MGCEAGGACRVISAREIRGGSELRCCHTQSTPQRLSSSTSSSSSHSLPLPPSRLVLVYPSAAFWQGRSPFWSSFHGRPLNQRPLMHSLMVDAEQSCCTTGENSPNRTRGNDVSSPTPPFPLAFFPLYVANEIIPAYRPSLFFSSRVMQLDAAAFAATVHFSQIIHIIICHILYLIFTVINRSL